MHPSTSVWEQIHGINEIQKTYVPPFMKNDQDQMQESPEDIKNKIYDMQVEEEAKRTHVAQPGLKPRSNVYPDYQEHSNLDKFALEQADRRQIKDMKFIRIKVKNLVVESANLIEKLQQGPFTLSINVPIPNPYQKDIGD